MSLEKRWALRRVGGVGRVSIYAILSSSSKLAVYNPARRRKSGVTNTALQSSARLAGTVATPPAEAR